MKTCPRCGFANLDTRSDCLKCKALLDHRAPPKIREPSRGFSLGTVGVRRFIGARAIPALLSAVRPRLPSNVPHRRPATAAMLGVIPGAGQIYNHQPLKALYFVAAWIAMAVATSLTLTGPLSYPVLFAWLGLWIWIASDGLSTAAMINGQMWTPRHSMTAWVAILSMVALVWFVGLLVVSPFVYFRLIGQDTFAPVFARGDIIWLDKWCLWFGGEPRRGEYIYYDPAGFTMHQGDSAIMYDAQNFIERVIGLPGETVVVHRDGDETTITVNGQPLDSDLYPLSTEFLPPHREFHVPADRWLILQSRTMPAGFIEQTMGASHAGTLSGADFEPERRWTNSCYVSRDQMIGRVFAIGHPPARRHWFPRLDEE